MRVGIGGGLSFTPSVQSRVTPVPTQMPEARYLLVAFRPPSVSPVCRHRPPSPCSRGARSDARDAALHTASTPQRRRDDRRLNHCCHSRWRTRRKRAACERCSTLHAQRGKRYRTDRSSSDQQRETERNRQHMRMHSLVIRLLFSSLFACPLLSSPPSRV